MEAKETGGDARKRSLDEAVASLWKVIDAAKAVLENEKMSPADKKPWAITLGNTISVLNKVLMTQKGEELGDEDIEEILKKVPERYEKMALRALKESIQAHKRS